MNITIRKLNNALDYFENSQYLSNKQYCTNCECFVDIEEVSEEVGFVCSSCYNNSHTEAIYSLELALDFLESNAKIRRAESLPQYLETAVVYIIKEINKDKRHEKTR